MKNIKSKALAVRTSIITMMIMGGTSTAFASSKSDPDFNKVTSPIISLLNSLLAPALAIVGAVGALYCILLGVKYAKAEEPQDREKAKAHLKSAIIGFVLIFVLIAVLKLLMGTMTDWAAQYNSNAKA